MTNEISLGWRLSRSFSGHATFDAVPFIDGCSLWDHYPGESLPDFSSVKLPRAVQHRPLTMDLSEFVPGRLNIDHDLIDWAGYSALTLNNMGYPAGKIPLLTCCGDDLCGFVACSMSLEAHEVV